MWVEGDPTFVIIIGAWFKAKLWDQSHHCNVICSGYWLLLNVWKWLSFSKEKKRMDFGFSSQWSYLLVWRCRRCSTGISIGKSCMMFVSTGGAKFFMGRLHCLMGVYLYIVHQNIKIYTYSSESPFLSGTFIFCKTTNKGSIQLYYGLVNFFFPIMVLKWKPWRHCFHDPNCWVCKSLFLITSIKNQFVWILLSAKLNLIIVRIILFYFTF